MAVCIGLSVPGEPKTGVLAPVAGAVPTVLAEQLSAAQVVSAEEPAPPEAWEKIQFLLGAKPQLVGAILFWQDSAVVVPIESCLALRELVEPNLQSACFNNQTSSLEA